jgi:hypothetical protein
MNVYKEIKLITLFGNMIKNLVFAIKKEVEIIGLMDITFTVNFTNFTKPYLIILFCISCLNNFLYFLLLIKKLIFYSSNFKFKDLNVVRK